MRCHIITKTATVDVSLVLALHREAALLQRTLLSLREAAQYARAEGIRVELVATLDRADEPTRQVLREFETDGFDGWTALEVDHGSLGPSRNSGIKAARGRFIYTCDGDDLISFNSIAAMFRLAETAGPGHIIFHQYLCVFGEHYHCWKRFPLDIVTPLGFLEQHPYCSAVFSHRSVFEDMPYTDSRVTSNYAYEDWHFNAECVARGYQILVAEDTIHFYRQHRGSLLDQANNHTTRQLLPCALFEPQIWVRVAGDAYRRLGLLEGARPRGPDSPGGSYRLGSAPHLDFIQAANAIDPDIDPLILRESTFSTNLDGPDLTAALAYHEICQVIGAQRFDEVFLLPSTANSGAERYVSDIIHVLYDMRPTARILVILCEPAVDGSSLNLLPPNATVLDLGNDWPQLTPEQCQLIVLKLIQSTAPRARLHLQQAPFPEGFYRRFKTILQSNPSVYYRLGNPTEVDSTGDLARPHSFNFVSENVQDLTLIIADDQKTVACDRLRIAVCPEKWCWMPARRSPDQTEAEAIPRAFADAAHAIFDSREWRGLSSLPHEGGGMEQLHEAVHVDPLLQLKQRVAFLEGRIGELQRASIAEKTRLSTRPLKARVALLEEEIAELRRASLEENARLEARLRQIESSRGYRLLRRYYALAGAPVTGPIIQILRKGCAIVLHPMTHLRAAS